VNRAQNARRALKMVFVVGAIVLAIALPLGWPLLSKFDGIGKLSLSPMQVLYTTLTLEITLAVYIWGVGNWSRFEPAKNTDDDYPIARANSAGDGAPPLGRQAGATPGPGALPAQ
jgi:hypothetical protein